MFQDVDLAVEGETEFVEGRRIRRNHFIVLHRLHDHVFHVLVGSTRKRRERLDGRLIVFNREGLRDPAR